MILDPLVDGQTSFQQFPKWLLSEDDRPGAISGNSKSLITVYK